MAPDSNISVILQGTFASEAAREEFVQTFSYHGIEILRFAAAPLPPPSGDDLSFMKKLAQTLAGIKARLVGTEVYQ